MNDMSPLEFLCWVFMSLAHGLILGRAIGRSEVRND